MVDVRHRLVQEKYRVVVRPDENPGKRALAMQCLGIVLEFQDLGHVL